jgi:hypothetical protein
MLIALVKLSDIGIIHGNLKLESLMYDGHHLSLLDFGSSIRGEYIHLLPLKSYIHSRLVMSTIPKRKHKRSDTEANYRNETKKF